MDRRFVLAVLAGSLTMLLVGFLLYAVVFADLFKQGAITLPGVMKDEPAVLWILIGQLAFGLLVTLVVSWRGTTSLAGGASTGALLGFLMAIGYDFAQYGTSNLWSMQATLLDPLITAALVGSGGAAIGYILGRKAGGTV